MSSIRQLPVEQELVVFVGTDTLREFRWLPDGLNPQDFTGWRCRIHIAPNRQPCTFHLTTEDGSVTLDDDGTIALRVSVTNAALIAGPNPAWALDLKDPNGIVTRLLRGRVNLVKDIGREGFTS